MTANLMPWFATLPALLVLGVAAWGVATARRNVGLVDMFWSLFFLLAATVACVPSPAAPRALADAGARDGVGAAACRLPGVRNWNAPEDRRYQAIRARNEPGFAWKSLYLVFGLQAVLAWLVSAPLAAAVALHRQAAGIVARCGRRALAAFGIASRPSADAQLARFRREPPTPGRVLDRGLWRYTPSSELLRRVLRLVGLLPDRRWPPAAGGRCSRRC